MFRWMFVTLAACGTPARLGGLEVSYGTSEPLPLVQPSTDVRRWYVPMQTRLGPVVWFVDTGYTYSTCDDDLVAALGLVPHGSVDVRGEIGSVEAQKVLLPRVFLGGHQIDELTCIVRDLDTTSSLSDPQEVQIAGVIGMDVLRKFRVRFDPTRGEVTLTDPAIARGLPAGGEGVVPLKRKGLRARLPLEIGGQVVWPILDTGASHTYVDGDALGLVPTEVAEGVTVRGTGAGGTDVRTIRSYAVDSVRVGPWTVPGLTLTDRTARWREPGLVGLDVLSRFEQEYDFVRGRVRLTPAAAADLPQFATWWPEQRLVPARLVDGSFEVRDAVLARGPGAAAGEGDSEGTNIAP